MKIMIVDDSKAIYMMVSGMLTERGHQAVWAEDGVDACEKLKTEKVDLILLDWNMPNMSGPEFLEKNQAENITEVPIVMMTTENKPDFIKKALQLGAVEYIMKPFTSDILFNKIELVFDLE
ncbi:response regulator [Bacteriovorax sp. Seq25_V]|uniref:response regulator n=1 Tax=Bacteriovorax sp. Seq25_V TaxID=1201288 RepID=UPI00038A3E29|nr:response regulator [Bacteriovorax sp. Seq25_V]EQC47154.1 putative chemotaxis protein Chey [Bacteriovorax sp. Seq25_V]